MSIQINALRNIQAVFETTKILIKENGLMGLALLPFAHTGFILNGKEKVVKSPKEVPTGATMTRSLLPGQLESDSASRDEGKDWIFIVHSHYPSASQLGWHQGWPVQGKVLPNSANLTREEAVARTRKEFTGI